MMTDPSFHLDVFKNMPTTPLNILAHFLKEMKEEVDTDEGSKTSSKKLRALIALTSELASGLLPYSVQMTTDSSSDAKKLLALIEELDYNKLFDAGETGGFRFYKEVSCDVIQGQLLKMLVRISGAHRVLEIGTFTGYAALNMAEALPSDGRLVTMEILPFFSSFCREFFDKTPQKDKIEILAGNAIEFLKSFGESGTQFDFIFIDAADHEYKDYLKIILDGDILARKGTIAIDNTVFKGATYVRNFPHDRFAKNGHVLDDFNKILQQEPRLEQVLLPIRDGLTIARLSGE